VQSDPHVGTIRCGVKRSSVKTLKTREGSQAAICAGPFLDERLLIQSVTGSLNERERVIPVASLDIVQEVGERLLSGGRTSAESG
jgi:hypothetical protein